MTQANATNQISVSHFSTASRVGFVLLMIAFALFGTEARLRPKGVG